MDLKRDYLRERLGAALWRSVGAANKLCRWTHIPRIHHALPGVRALREETPLTRPIFMVGSPRSGTTILGKILGHQGDVLFLSEARPIWYLAMPEMNEDLFHWEGDRLWGRIYLDERDVTVESQQVLEKEFGRMLTITGHHRLMEKMPVNLFRARWLNAMWPDSSFIQITRDPFSTTSSKTACWPSIDERDLPGVALRRLAFRIVSPEHKDLLDSVRSAYEWYLFEWRIFMEEGERLRALWPDRYAIFRLEDAQRNPGQAFEQMCAASRLCVTDRLRRAQRLWLDPKLRLAEPRLDRSRCRELLGDSAERWGYPF